MWTVLLVEDEALVAEVVQEQLVEDGLTVVWASDAFQALALLNSPTSRLDALLTDIDLGPGPSGFELACRAREIDPSMPVIYVTGRCEAQFAKSGVAGSTLIPKPFRPAEVSEAVKRSAAKRPCANDRMDQASPRRLAS
jgi:DNA-binding response OmpR family regulator